jgi:hypothetical protein
LPDFSAQSSIDIARRLEIRGPDARSWIVLLLPPQETDQALENLRTDLSSMLEQPNRVFDLLKEPFEQLSVSLHQPDDDIVILVARADLEATRWSSLDVMRSAFERKGPIVLWLSPDCLPRLSEHAPNIRSFVGGGIFAAGPDGGMMTEEDRQERLKQLAERYLLTDDEIVARAQSGNLSSEPHFIEWLVLLGRGDLV